MKDTERVKAEQAWQEAVAGDVVRALNNPEDYPPDVYVIVQAEAARRHLRADTALSPSTTPFTRVTRALQRGRPVVRVIARFPPAHPLMSACLLGVSLYTLGALLVWVFRSPTSPRIWQMVACILAVYVACLVWICWPLRSYLTVAVIPLVVWTCNKVAAARNFIEWAETTSRRVVLLNLLINFAYSVVGLSLLLSLAVFIRRRIWPVYGVHQCEKCGYDLRGLPQPRCPECGTAFVPAEEEEDASEPSVT